MSRVATSIAHHRNECEDCRAIHHYSYVAYKCIHSAIDSSSHLSQQTCFNGRSKLASVSRTMLMHSCFVKTSITCNRQTHCCVSCRLLIVRVDLPHESYQID